MELSNQIARQFRDVHYGGNWTSVNLRETLTGITWEQANTNLDSLNSIVQLVYHIHYYVHAVLAVLKGGPLDAHDKFSFDHPPIHSQKDWEDLLEKVWKDVEEFANQIEQIPEEKWESFLSEEKYGNYYRNIHGIIEHTHYHLGQISLIKKMLLNPGTN